MKKLEGNEEKEENIEKIKDLKILAEQNIYIVYC